MNNTTKCPHCNAAMGFEAIAEEVKIPENKKDTMTFVRCVKCKTAITAFDRSTLLFCINQVLNRLPNSNLPG